MSESGIKVRELGKSISWKKLEAIISDGVITALKGNLTAEDINIDLDGYVTFATGIKNLIKAQTPRKVRKDKNIPRRTTLIG